ncbi:MAG: hypothetical protein O3B84_00880 [Chloroflexi bacterium]|nr:hypothetical protein [Chloroflexota bacterium]
MRIHPGRRPRQTPRRAIPRGRAPVAGLAMLLIAAFVLACAPAAAPDATTGPSIVATGTPVPRPVENEPPVRAPLGVTFELPHGQTRDIEGLGEVRFVDIVGDSRCPKDVTCIRAGEAILEFRLLSFDQNLVLAWSAEGLNQDRARVGEFDIRVVDIQPAPKSTQQITPGDYRATLVVDRATDDGSGSVSLPGDDLVIREIPIASVDVLILESYPYQIHVRVVGNLQSGCAVLHEVSQARNGAEIVVSITSAQPKDAICTAIAPDYTETISLDGTFIEGEYGVTVNGLRTPFSL